MSNFTLHSKNYNGLLIGAIFTTASLLLTFTPIVLLISVLPGVLIELISATIISNDPYYSNVAKLTIFLLTIGFLFTLTLSLSNIKRSARQGSVSTRQIVLMMIIFYFIVHSLGFYLYQGFELTPESHEQLLPAAINSVRRFAFVFIFIGLLIDITKNIAAETCDKPSYSVRPERHDLFS